MAGHVVLFEDEGYRNFYPLTLNNPVYSLRCGIRMLGEKIQAAYPGATFVYHVRKLLEPFLKEYLSYRKIESPVNECKAEKALFVNGRALWCEDFGQNIRIEGPDKVFVKDSTVIAARLSGANLAAVDWNQPITLDRLPKVEKIEIDYPVLKFPWNLVQQNPKEIAREFKILGRPGELEGKIYEGVHILGKENVYVAPGAKVTPGVVIDAEEGPVFIDKGAKIFPNATIEGPTYVGKKSAVKIGAKIYEGTSIGPVCKVGGEVEESIIHSYSNKQHDGFLGHAYLGLWVN
ncbi:MAG TPA: putative sugar nucleotidyl transferase, partial [bacterium]|nr:putative sugar nucleotidyl transferase [bacterium]